MEPNRSQTSPPDGTVEPVRPPVRMTGDWFMHERALVESSSVGAGTRIWAFAHVLPRARIGRDCNLCDHVFIENDVVIGDRVTVKCGVQVWDGVTIEDDVFIGPNATFTNDPFPRSRVWMEKLARTVVGKGASIGANATILPGLTIGQGAMVGAGAVVTHSVPAHAVVIGNPAFIHRYVDAPKGRPPSMQEGGHDSASSVVAGVRLVKLKLVKDLRGSLAAAELGSEIPFTPKRCFVVFDVRSRGVRGEHAHKNLHQMLVCVRGECSVVVDDGVRREHVHLDRPDLGLYVPPMVWAQQFGFSEDATLVVLASEAYEATDYIRDYDEFLRETVSRNIHPR